MRKIPFLLLCLLACCGRPGPAPQVVETFPVRLGAISGPAKSGVNMLYVSSPWITEEFMALDFPEHCWGKNFSGVSTDTRDGPQPTRWRFNDDSTAAWMEYKARDGNLFHAGAAVDSMAVRLSIGITNNSAEPIEDIRILVCTRPHNMRAFRDTNYALTYVAVDSKPVRLGAGTHFQGKLPPRMPPAWILNIKGGPDNRTLSDLGWFSAEWGRRMFRLVEERADPALIGICSRDEPNRWIAAIWEPSRALFSNPHIPCIHSDPVPPDCPPGATTRAEGVVFFHSGTFEALVERAAAWRDRQCNRQETGRSHF